MIEYFSFLLREIRRTVLSKKHTEVLLDFVDEARRLLLESYPELEKEKMKCYSKLAR